ncbi:uncharacterized protein LOC144299352 [Canis aureus]
MFYTIFCCAFPPCGLNLRLPFVLYLCLSWLTLTPHETLVQNADKSLTSGMLAGMLSNSPLIYARHRIPGHILIPAHEQLLSVHSSLSESPHQLQSQREASKRPLRKLEEEKLCSELRKTSTRATSAIGSGTVL